MLREGSDKITSLPPSRGFAGLSPHAPYSTTPALLEQTARLARKKKWRVTMHVAESEAEFEMWVHRRGPMFDWLRSQRDMSDCGERTPVAQVFRSGLLGENFLAIHANYLQPDDISILAKTGSSVVHCPRSHTYFRHQPFPWAELTAAGVNVCLGTDSRASMRKPRAAQPELNMFVEMRGFAASTPAANPRSIVQMATMNGARAIGWQGRAGELSPNALADVIAIPY